MADGVRLSDLVVAMARRGTPLASETGLFIALGIAEVLRAQPARVNPDDVSVTADGDVVLARALARASEGDAVRAVASIVEAIVDPPPAGVKQMVARARAGTIASLAALSAELEALLVPLNRGAARRVLGRLAREHARTGAANAPAVAPAVAPATGALAADALDTAPDRDARAVPASALLARDGARRGAADDSGSTALATDPTGESGPPNVIVEGPPASIPPIPPPPRLGSLAELPIGPSAGDTQPDPPTGYSDRPPARRGRRSADSTEPDGTTGSEPAPAERTELDRDASRGPSSGRVWFALVAAIVLLVAVTFVAWRMNRAASEAVPPPPTSGPPARVG